MADAKQKWQDARRQILLALDLPAEYVALGLRLANGARPNAKGWIDCHVYDQPDHSPSAGINVQDGPYLGRYKDFHTGKSYSLFDFAATIAGRFGGQFREALAHYARLTKIKLPDGNEELAADRLELFGLTFGVLSQYAAGKPGVTVAAIQAVGSCGARWPKNLPAERTNHLIATPMYGSALLDLEPIGWHCVAANPRSQIRQYRGPSADEKWIKTMTIGEYGLMCVDGLHRLPEADVVNVTEGISDLYAAQAVLIPWLAESPGDRRHVVISAGAANYHPKPEWMQHFAGKEVRLWFDVGDPNNAGQNGAAVWVASLLQVGATVRNVQLPLGPSGGKNDLRAWLTRTDGGTDGGGAPRTYADMDAYAATFEPVRPDDKEAQQTQYEALLKGLGLVVIGEHEGSQKIECYSEPRQKTVTIADIDKLTTAKLVQMLGDEPVEQYIHDGKESVPGKSTLAAAKTAIASAASGKLFHADEKFGAGVWEVEGQILIIKAREVGLLSAGDGGTTIEHSNMPFYRGRILDSGPSSGNWCDFGVLSRHLVDAQRDAWCQDAFTELSDLLRKWYWRQRPAPEIAASLVVCSWLQTLWNWRPQVFITASSDTGKSLLLDEVLADGIFKGLSLYVQKPTEAAIRQHLRHHARVVLVDEFEHDNHRQKVFELFRTSSRGGRTIRGTADQRGMSFQMRHIPWLAAVEMGLKKQADRNRYIVLDLDDIPPASRGKIVIPSSDQLRDLGQRLLAVGLRHFRTACTLAASLKGLSLAGVPGRVIESFSVPAGMFAAIGGMDLQAAERITQDWLAGWDFTMQAARDDVDVLSEILTSYVTLETGKRSTVTKLLNRELDNDAAAALAGVGIKLVRGFRTNDRVVFFCTDTIRRNLLSANSDFRGHSIDQYLLRLRGATRSRQRLGGNQRFRGVDVPCDTIAELFYEDDETGETYDFGKEQEF